MKIMRCAVSAAIALSFVAAVAFAQTDKRAYFVQNVVPRKYPQLIDYLRTNGPLQVSWITQSREPQSVTARISPEGHLVIETAIFAGSAATASTTKDRTFVVMVDRSLKGRIEYLSAHPPGGRHQAFEYPKDEFSLHLWDASLAMIFRESRCCLK